MRGLSKELIHLVRGASAVTISRQWAEQVLRTPLLTNSFYLMANAGVSAALGFLFWIVVARLYPTETVGLSSALISAASLLAFIGSLGLGFGLIRYLPAAGPRAGALINSAFTLAGLASVAVALAFLAGLPLWSPTLGFVREDLRFLLAFILFVAGWSLFLVMGQTFVGFRRAEFTLGTSLAFSLLKLGLVVGLATLFGVFGIVASWGLAAIVAVGLGLFLFLPRLLRGYRPLPALSRQVSNKMVHFSFVNYLAEGLWNLPGWLLPVMVVNLVGARANAFFFISVAMVSLLFTIPLAISTSLFAEGSHREERLGQDLRRSLKASALLLLPAMVIMFLVGDRLLLLLGQEYSREGTRLLWLLIPLAIPAGLNSFYLATARVQRRLKDVVVLTASVAVGTLALAWVLLPYLGILGAGVAWLASHTLVAIAFLPRLRGILGARPGEERGG